MPKKQIINLPSIKIPIDMNEFEEVITNSAGEFLWQEMKRLPSEVRTKVILDICRAIIKNNKESNVPK